MGYDVTFHPVGIYELQYYVFDVVNEPKLAGERAKALAAHPEKHRMVLQVYRSLERHRDWSSWSGDVHFGSTVAYCAAATAGFLHPFWYSRDGAVTFLGRFDSSVLSLFTSLTKLATGVVARMPDSSLGILGLNYTGSGLLKPDRVIALLAALKSLAKEPLPSETVGNSEGLSVLDAVFDYGGLASLLGAIHYAIDHGLGLMEAADVVVPLADETVTNPENFRQHDADERDRLLAELWDEFNE
jgi:hypothetical protein